MRFPFLFAAANALLCWSAFALSANTYIPASSHTYLTGKRGGCYYINKNGNKTYVDRRLCR